MAITLRTAAATNFATFDGGDSIFKSVSLNGALLEAAELVDLAIAQYNQENPIVPFPDIEVSTTGNSYSSSIAVPYRTIAGVKKAVTYLTNGGYDSWVVPTTGELAGLETLLDAYIYIANACTYGNDKLRASSIFNSPKDFLTFTDDGNANQYLTTLTMPINAGVDAAGEPFRRAVPYFNFLDLQEGLPA
jgi:hypothetical protein